ncbi:MAG: hypothetical protein A3K09_00285 [Nitrospinae bacterium RIFCSPLOWO2_12_FULL_47_7]|nr:MAG: hypothetical protein A3K09_00285 [Nitrospinae bacterium RIFCSPLOWO2_12_FULL_47_7]
MKKTVSFLIILALFLVSCTGADTIVKKKWQAKDNTIGIVDLSANTDGIMEAGTLLTSALENSFTDTMFVVKNEKPKYQLKFKVLKYQEGSRWARMASMGISDSARGELQIKAALYEGPAMVGAWEVNTWVKGGVTGGSRDELFNKAAKEIIEHMKYAE